MTQKKFDILSPDGIPIVPFSYDSERSAKHALRAWLRQYERQGYYLTADHERIDLLDLPKRCTIVVSN